jgi:SulP family sulfate permease
MYSQGQFEHRQTIQHSARLTHKPTLSVLSCPVTHIQDVGLIFLSSMATSIADIGREEGLADSVVVGTALLNMAVATLLVGLLTWVVGES